jgi:hypothetical protein
MTLTDWIAELRAAGVARVTLDIGGHLQPIERPRSFHADQAPRPAQADANAQAESNNVHPAEPDDGDADQRARDLELMHSE